MDTEVIEDSIKKIIEAFDEKELEAILKEDFNFSDEEVKEVMSCYISDKSCIISKVLEIIIRKKGLEQNRLAEIVNAANLKQRLEESEEAYRKELNEMLKKLNQDVIKAIIDYLDAVRQENDSRFSMR
ncbi:MAG: hypothetical protein IBX55_17835 [Methyloprofundus sp.]|nr:hypothetical protein [Methyloprofundus sp.]